MKLIPILLATALTVLAANPTISYWKKFPGSVPAYVAITVTEDGTVTYTEAEDEAPESFKIEPDAAAAIFELAGKVHRFADKLEADVKVANMGQKTFRWTEDGKSTEVSYNYTTNEDARALADWFERITESRRIWIDLQRTARFDRLGVHEVLGRLETAWTKKRVVGKEQFLALLSRISKNESYMHMARERAAQLDEAFRGSTPR